jgi:hypothetical protein
MSEKEPGNKLCHMLTCMSGGWITKLVTLSQGFTVRSAWMPRRYYALCTSVSLTDSQQRVFYAEWHQSRKVTFWSTDWLHVSDKHHVPNLLSLLLCETTKKLNNHSNGGKRTFDTSEFGSDSEFFGRSFHAVFKNVGKAQVMAMLG